MYVKYKNMHMQIMGLCWSNGHWYGALPALPTGKLFLGYSVVFSKTCEGSVFAVVGFFVGFVKMCCLLRACGARGHGTINQHNNTPAVA